MKKKLLTAALALVLLSAGVAAAFSASQSETLVSVSYLSGAFWNDLKATVKQEVDRDTSFILNEAAAQAGQGSGSAFSAQNGVNGDRVSGITGSGMIWTSGSASVQSGALVDATTGTELAVGNGLTAGHRYLAGSDVVLVVSSSSAQWMGEGQWTLTHGDPVQPPASLPFTDVVQGAWYYEDVAFVYQNELFNGDSPTRFAPDDRMQRCMMTTVLHRLAGKPVIGYSGLFRDIPDGQWYTQGTIWAGTLGVVSGVEPGRFDPFANVTRQEIAVILHRYAEKMGYDMSASASLAGFRDAGAVASWGTKAMSWAVGAGILNGSSGALLPNGDATRAEVAAMLHRFASWSQRQ